MPLEYRFSRPLIACRRFLTAPYKWFVLLAMCVIILRGLKLLMCVQYANPWGRLDVTFYGKHKR